MNEVGQLWVKRQEKIACCSCSAANNECSETGGGATGVKTLADGDTYIYLPLFHYNFCMTMRKSGRT